MPKSVAYLFHDVYQGGRRLKTKHRHIYEPCDDAGSNIINIECEKQHNIRKVLNVFKYKHVLFEQDMTKVYHKKSRECNIFSWC